jgi:secondary thiamine-phosphate synthase enzyme
LITLQVRTHAREELRDITDAVRAAVADAGLGEGTVHLWSMHTTCALTVNEGADPDVAADIVRFMKALVPKDGPFRHDEGNSDAHLKTAFFGPGLTLLVDDGRLVLGTWQRVFLAEWDGPRDRTVKLIARPA